jgi:O-antigen/teichoic acid export membrane protein
MFLPVLVATAWLPRLVDAFTHGRDRLIKAARTPIELILVLSVPVAAVVAMCAPEAIHVIFGPKYAQAVPVMVVLAICIPPIYLNIILTQVLLAEKRQAVWTAVMAGAAVVNPLINLVLIPLTERRYHNGAIGAAISLVLTELLMDVIAFVLVGRHVFDRRAVKRCALAIVASAGMWGVYYAASPLGTIPALLAGGLTLILLIIVLRIPTPEEIAMLQNRVGRLRRRSIAGSS